MSLLEVHDLKISFGSGHLPAVRGICFSLEAGEIVGLVGESGSGKSVTALSLMGLLPAAANLDSGAIIFKGRDLTTLDAAVRREICGRDMGMVFQEPLTALNPVITIGEQVAEIFRYRAKLPAGEAKREAEALLSRVGLPNPREAAASYPHRFSGGMRQRVVLALALALSPELLIADEPTTALDPTIAAQILALLKNLAEERGAAVLFITHNLRLLAGLAGRVMVMYGGLIMEEAPAAEIFVDPRHPYTQGLLAALPPPASSRKALRETSRRLMAIAGAPPRPGEIFPGCLFAPRCPMAFELCAAKRPALTRTENRSTRCFLYGPAEDGGDDDRR